MKTKPISELSFAECCEALNLKSESVEYPLSLQELAEVDRLILDRLNMLLEEQKAKYESCTTIAELNAFAKRYPNTCYAAKAKQRVEKLKKRNRIFGLSALGIVLIVVLSIVLNNVIAEQERRERERIEQEERERFYAATHGKTDYHDWVDLGLSVKWATCNVGASSPEEYGDYFAWGETETKSAYHVSNAENTRNSRNRDFFVLPLGGRSLAGNREYDAARAKWGGSWRLPTKAELEELTYRCRWRSTMQGGNLGYEVTGPNGNSIFLPAAGYRASESLRRTDERGFYWSAVPRDDSDAYLLDFDVSEKEVKIDYNGSFCGRSVRPVLD